MSSYSRFALLVSLLVFSSQSVAYEFLIFKRVSDDLGIESLPYKYTVWHVDAIESVIGPINSHAATIQDKQIQFEYLTDQMKKIDKASLAALVLMGFSASAKMRAYGLTAVPSAVLLDDDGLVVEMWNGIDHGTQLQSVEATE